jgi:hypothetical protein
VAAILCSGKVGPSLRPLPRRCKGLRESAYAASRPGNSGEYHDKWAYTRHRRLLRSALQIDLPLERAERLVLPNQKAKTEPNRQSPPGETTVPTMTEAAAAATNGTVADVGDRRRPGRAKTVSPWLVPLLRRPFGAAAAAEDTETAAQTIEHDLREKPGISPLTFRGIAIAMLFAIPLWGLIGVFIAWLLRTR